MLTNKLRQDTIRFNGPLHYKMNLRYVEQGALFQFALTHRDTTQFLGSSNPRAMRHLIIPSR